MDKKLYYIWSGEEHNWTIEGAADTEEDAAMLCARHNSEIGYIDWEYEETKYLENDVDRIKIFHHFIVSFDGNIKISGTKYYGIKYGYKESYVRDFEPYYDVYVFIRANKDEIAKKFAIELLDKYLKEKTK